MKKIIIFILLCPILLMAQEETPSEKDVNDSKENIWQQRWTSNKPVSIGLRSSLSTFSPKKNEFLSDTYKVHLGYMVGSRIYIKGLFGLGADFLFNRATVERKDLVGPFNTAKFNQYNVYGFIQYPISEQFSIEGKMGGGDIKMNHFFQGQKFILDYNSFNYGLGIYYAIDKLEKLEFFASGDVYKYKSSTLIILPEQYKDYFEKSSMIQFSVGVNFVF